MRAETLPAATTGSSEPVARLSPPDDRSLSFQTREDAAIWTREWVGLGFAADIPAPGDILPVTVGNHGVHVERQADGTLVGRFNKAQHGGCRSVPLQCQTGAKTKCSFTACGHSRDRRPILAGDADRLLHLDQYLGLRPERLLTVATKTWGPLIVARLDPLATSPMDWPDLERGLAPEADGPGAETLWLERDANWKHLMIALAARERSTHVAARFPNVVVLAGQGWRCVVALQPTALQRTLCRIRVYPLRGSADQEVPTREALNEIVVRCERAEAWRSDASGVAAGGPVRSWFEARVAAAFSALEHEARSGAFYRTDERGDW